MKLYRFSGRAASQLDSPFCQNKCSCVSLFVNQVAFDYFKLHFFIFLLLFRYHVSAECCFALAVVRSSQLFIKNGSSSSINGSSSSIHRRHQFRKRFFIHHVPQARAADKQKPKQYRKHKKSRNEIMQTENSVDPGQTSIKKLNEARERVTNTNQRRHFSH